MALSRQLFVRNLPYRATDSDLLEAFSAHGSVKRAFVVLDPVTKSSRGFGYVTFTTPEDLQKAKSAAIELFGRLLHCKPADQKPLQDRSTRPKKRPRDDDEDEEKETEPEPPKSASISNIIEGTIEPARHSDRRRCISVKLPDSGLYGALKLGVLSRLASSKLISRVQPPSPDDKKAIVLMECPTRAAAVDCYMQLKEFREEDSIKFTFSYLDKKPSEDEEKVEPKIEVKEEPTPDPWGRDVKNFRLIVRNLPFSVTEKALKEKFNPFGNIIEIVLPKKPDGTPKGFAFVQFSDREFANKALEKMNMGKIEGRTIAVDWAVPKVVYQKQLDEEKETMEESGVDLTGEDSANDENEASKPPEPVIKKELPKKPPPSHDIGEGRTVFIRGLSFSTDEAGLMSAFEKLFGSVFYAKICLEESGRSKGTAFVKFINKEHADECIKRSTESPLILDGRRLVVSMALDRKGAENAKIENAKLKDDNDPRNLRLAAVGYIKQGMKEAEGLLPVDLEKRHALYAGNCAKLRNPIMFVSDTRLSVHNIPTSIDDKQLKEVVLKALNDKTARISESRIMRDLDRPNSAGVGKSRGYAFVTLNEPKHAMAALQKLNNNPEIFGENKRLIVQFSIENRKVLDQKKRCLEKSREHLKNKQATNPPANKDGAQKDKVVKPKNEKKELKQKSKRSKVVKSEIKTEK